MQTGIDDFYIALEDRFRGSKALIKSRQSVYIEILRPFKSLLEGRKAKALDIGCGRGEWLALLDEQGWIEASGVDGNTRMVEACIEQGFDTHLADIFDHLANTPDASLDIATSFHVIEHLPLDLQLKLISEIRRVLRPQGIALIETPNPENIQVGSHTFFMDPTHTKPVPPMLLQFMCEFSGFSNAAILYLQPRKDWPESTIRTDLNRYLLSILGGPQDYAIVMSNTLPDNTAAHIKSAIRDINRLSEVQLPTRGGLLRTKRKAWIQKLKSIFSGQSKV